MLKYLPALLLSAFAATSLHAQNAVSLTAVDTYGTFESGGVVAEVSGDANGNAQATLEWQGPGDSGFRAAHPLVRIDATHFVGSLFWLQPGQTYSVRVTLSDVDGVTGSPTASQNVTTRAENPTFVPTRTLYVAPGGSNENAGTDPSAPLQSIQHAADVSQAGDLVSIAPGLYREQVNVSVSGTDAQPVVFRASAPGAVLDGADPAITAGVEWTPQSNGVYSYHSGYGTALVVTDQGRLFPYTSVAELAALAAGAPGGFYADGMNVYVKFSDGSTPTQHTMNVSRYDSGFYVEGASNVRIQNFEIRYYGSDEYGRGVYLRFASQCEVSGSSIHENAGAGVWIKGGERNLVEHNDIGDSSIINWPWALAHDSAGDTGVYMTDNNGQGNVIRRNFLHDTYDGLHPCGSDAPDNAFTSETDVYENTIYTHSDDAIESDGYCANVRIWNNTISDSLMAFSVAPAAPGPVWIVRNTAYDIGNVPSYLVFGQIPSGIKINSDYPEIVGPLLVYNNTFFSNVAGVDALTFFDPGLNTALVSRNNLFAAPNHALTKINTIPLDLDYDDLYSIDAASLVRWYSTTYATLADLQNGVEEEMNGLSADPTLTNPAGGDFTPLAGSPLIDRGVVIPGINDTVRDGLPDIGAVERVDLPDSIFANGFD
jgi:parallel beta-helix repeat protein